MIFRLLLAMMMLAVQCTVALADVPPRKGNCTTGDESNFTLAAVALVTAALLGLRIFWRWRLGRA
ncbi:MAG: hypothetical protein HPKKFMNG_02656 [Planctomycetes bacterium]|nr:hypothetical protein [Planctomycetota bacterium]